MARASEEIASLSDAERQRLYQLIRAASEVPLSDAETERIAAILWADRGAGVFASLEAGFKLFHLAEEEPPSRRRKRRSIASLSAGERQALLAALLANRHVPPETPPPPE
ncbi:MAG: hypothetical protein RMM58_04430 [Chloroflexota bacterium]|nr:hypothetical protein [Dehalococcoidia bacterium]MDW8253109.1 hypothetical protein [Chloroflexota bacterium]